MSIHFHSSDEPCKAMEALRKVGGIDIEMDNGDLDFYQAIFKIRGVVRTICAQIEQRRRDVPGGGSKCSLHSSMPSEQESPLENDLKTSEVFMDALRAFATNLSAPKIYNGEGEELSLTP